MSYNDTMKLSSKHLKTFRAVFDDPVRSDIGMDRYRESAARFRGRFERGPWIESARASKGGSSGFPPSTSAKRDREGSTQVGEAILD
jgi:hypothetical protein